MTNKQCKADKLQMKLPRPPPGLRDSYIANDELLHYVERLNHIYAEQVQELEHKANLVKMIASGQLETAPIWVPAPNKKRITSFDTLPGIYDNKQAVPRYVPPRAACKRPSPIISSKEYNRIVNLTVQTLARQDSKSRRPATARPWSPARAGSPALANKSTASVNLKKMIYGNDAKVDVKKGYPPLKIAPFNPPGRTKSAPPPPPPGIGSTCPNPKRKEVPPLETQKEEPEEEQNLFAIRPRALDLKSAFSLFEDIKSEDVKSETADSESAKSEAESAKSEAGSVKSGSAKSDVIANGSE